VGPRRVHAHHPQPLHVGDLDPRAGHEHVAEIVAQPVVVAGHDRHGAGGQQRREGALEQLQLAQAAPVRDVTGREDVVDADLDERPAELRGARLVLGRAPEVQVGYVRQRQGAGLGAKGYVVFRHATTLRPYCDVTASRGCRPRNM